MKTEIDQKKVLFIFQTHYNNAKGICKNEFNLTDAEFETLKKRFDNDEIKIEKPKQKRVSGLKKIAESGGFIDRDAKNLAFENGIPVEVEVEVERLVKKHGYSVTETPFKTELGL